MYGVCLYAGACFVQNANAVEAFPGALGFGANATGGRKGSVYHVTNLNDSGTGSFRDAVSAPNRIIVFDVGGNIDIKTAIQVKSNITIAGQTAPGGGVAIEGGKISCGSQSNIIIRHLRMRPGKNTANRTDDGLNMYRSKNCIVDHCSIEFAPWNNIGGSGSNDNKSTDITFQYCLIADPIDQQFGAHIESVNSQWTWYGNCFANTHNRNPLDKVNDVFVNNVLYNYQAGYTTHTSTKFSHDIVNNYFVGGPSSGSTDNTWFQVDKNQSIYYSGNMKDRNKDGILNGAETTPYWYQGTGTVLSSPWSSVTKQLPTVSAATAFRMVSSMGGARPVDPMDALVWSQVESVGKAGTMYTTHTQTGLDNNGFGTIKGGDKPTDSDGDGMPDYWESAMNLNNSKDDAMAIASSGYANIEEYINWLGALHEQTDANTDLVVDLSTYTSGWKAITASFKVSDAVNGSVTLNGTKATFSPNANFYGLGSFNFIVTGNDGTNYTATINVLVLKGGDVVLGPPSLTKQGGGSSSQSIYAGSEVAGFNFLWTNATDVNVTWQPAQPKGISVNIDKANKKVIFSGSIYECNTYSYTVTAKGSDAEAVKTGTFVVNGRSNIFSCDSVNSDWTSSKYWSNGIAPTDCDSAIIRKGEVNAVCDMIAPTFVEKEGVFRVRKDLSAQELHMMGGSIKSYTSNPLFQLTVCNLFIDENTTMLVGSTETSEFKLNGVTKGSGDITKNGKGVLVQSTNCSGYSGRWSLAEGTMKVTNAQGLGSNGIDLNAGTKLTLTAANTTGSISVAEGAGIVLNADLTVDNATLGSHQLANGTYTTADYPSFISESGKLIVLTGVDATDVDDIDREDSMIVYPNPISSIASICLPNNDSYQISVCDLTGGIMMRFVTSGSTTVDFSDLPNGVYFINLKGKEQEKNIKVMVKH